MNRSLLKNGLYNTVAGIVRIGIGLLTIPVLIRTLGIEEYGLWTLAVTTISIVTLAEAGLSLATTMFVSQDLERQDIEGLSQTLTITGGAMLILSALAGSSLWLFAVPIVSSFAKLQLSQQVVAVQALQLGAVVVWARLLQQVLVGLEQACQRYDLSNAVNTFQTLALSLGMLAVALSGGKTIELMELQIGIVLVGLIAHCWLGWFLLRGFGVKICWSRQRGLEILYYSLMTWLTAIGGVLFNQMDKVIVGAVLGTSELGIYAAITNIATQINVLSSLPVQPMVPALSTLAARDEFDIVVVEKRVKQAFVVNSLFALGLGSILLSIAPFLLQIILGFAPSVDVILVFRIAVLAYALYSLNAVGFYLCLGLNAARMCMMIQIVSGIVALILIWIGADQFGLIGAMLGNMGFVMTLWMNSYGSKLLRIQGHKWLQWLLVPLSLTILVFLVSVVSGDALMIKLPIMTLLVVGLLSWYVFHQFSTLKLIYEKFRYNGS
jgi:O-antigen/teichoic acid export membrane protein